MKNLRTKIIYRGGSIPVPSYLQKGEIRIKDGLFCVKARGGKSDHSIDLSIPLKQITKAVALEKKYYSSVGYFLLVEYLDEKGTGQTIEMEIRCLIRRGRTQALMNLWVEMLSSNAYNGTR